VVKKPWYVKKSVDISYIKKTGRPVGKKSTSLPGRKPRGRASGAVHGIPRQNQAQLLSDGNSRARREQRGWLPLELNGERGRQRDGLRGEGEVGVGSWAR
jgi:hypothetical protein